MTVKSNKNVIMNSIYFKIAVAIVVIFAAAIACFIVIDKDVKKWNDKIYSGVRINSMDLSGKNKEEAMDLLTKEYSAKLQDKKINILIEDKKMNYKYSDLLANYNFEKAVQEAIDFGKDKSLLQKRKLIKNKENEKYEIGLEFVYDEDKLCELEENIEKKVNIKPSNAKVTINRGNIAIVPEKVGYKINHDDMHETIKAALNGDLIKDTELTFKLNEDKASITSTDLGKIKPQPMSTFTTSYASSDEDRSFNIQLVTELVNGIVLMPGEEFSYSTTSQKGIGKYKMGIAYVNDKPVPSEGGGICQASTTLYRAVMKANIRSTERHNHSLPVGYATLGLDATVAWGYLDYKFKNPYDFPIYIEGITENKTVTFNIYGDPSILGNKTYDMVSEISGKEAKSYQVTYENGQEVKREFIAKDTYK